MSFACGAKPGKKAPTAIPSDIATNTWKVRFEKIDFEFTDDNTEIKSFFNTFANMTAEEFEAAFHGIDLPQEAQLYTGVKITNIPKFLETSLNYLKNNAPSRMTEVISDRLQRLLEIVQESNP